VRRLALLYPLALLACEAPFSYPVPVASIVVSPTTADLFEGDSVRLNATVRDSAGRTLTDRVVVWSSSEPARVHVSDAGLVTALGPGAATITARAEEASATATVHVTIKVTSVGIDQGDLSLVPGATLRLTATPRGQSGDPLGGRAITWTSADTSLVRIGPDGSLSAAPAQGATTVTATVEGVSAGIVVRIERLTFTTVSAGEFHHTCGRVTDGRAFCWGLNSLGQLGVAAIGLSTTPVATAGAPRLADVTAGAAFTCGRTDAGLVYCWGSAARGRLGTGTTTNTPRPAPVPLDHPLYTLSSGWNHTCGVGGDGRGSCWGEFPQSGNYPSPVARTPVSVLGEVSYTAIAAGEGFSCGLGSDSLAYCWGTNFSQRLGDDSLPYSVSPVPVDGGVRFTSIAAGGLHACGLTTVGAAYCWGDNASGQLGAGDSAPMTAARPQPVAGNFAFTTITTGSRSSCALTSTGEAYCWGANDGGQLGSTATGLCNGLPCSRVPVPVSGGVRYTAISVGDQHSCALGTQGVLYCWGKNDAGQLGDGTLRDRPAPTRVAGQP
jgi:alpha-tubulin suppressor-like RCC1 family protein